MKKINIVQLGMGTVGRAVTKALDGRKGVRIVGAVDPDPGKIGRDVGEIAGIDPLHVKVEADAERLLAETDADIVVHTASSYLHEAAEQIKPALLNGIDVVSAAEELGYPYARDRGLAARLERLAKANGATVLGTGLSPGWASDYLILAASAASIDVKSVRYLRISNASPFRNSIVGKHFGLGLAAQEFADGVAKGEITGHIGFVESAHVIADRIGWKLDRIERTVKPTHDKQGQFISTETSVRAYRNDQLAIELVMRSMIDPNTEVLERIVIDADPPVNLEIKPCIAGLASTAHALVNAIPHVINAAPGLITPGDLPLVHAFNGDFRLLLK